MSQCWWNFKKRIWYASLVLLSWWCMFVPPLVFDTLLLPAKKWNDEADTWASGRFLKNRIKLKRFLCRKHFQTIDDKIIYKKKLSFHSARPLSPLKPIFTRLAALCLRIPHQSSSSVTSFLLLWFKSKLIREQSGSEDEVLVGERRARVMSGSDSKITPQWQKASGAITALPASQAAKCDVNTAGLSFIF